MEEKFIKIGLVSISDRASAGVYEDKGIPELEAWLKKTLKTNFHTNLLSSQMSFPKSKVL